MSSLSLPRVRGALRHVGRLPIQVAPGTQRRPFGYTRTEIPKNPGRKATLAIGGACTLVAFAVTSKTHASPAVSFDALGQEDQSGGTDRQSLISYEEVQKHVSVDDCWVIIQGNVYNVASFIQKHPGGPQAILAEAGQDVSEIFNMIHPSDALKMLPPEAYLGPVDLTTLPEPGEKELTKEEEERQAAREIMPPAQNLLLLQDFEDWAQIVLSDTAWAYYRSAADEEKTFQENRDAFQRYFFRPRILRDMTEGSTDTSIMGIPSAIPVFIAPAAMAKLGHPLGEVNITKAAGEMGIVQGISCNASCSLDEMFQARRPEQPLIFQLYLNKDRTLSQTLIQKVEKLGAKAIIFTVDVCWESKRTLDVRGKIKSNQDKATGSAPASSVSQAIGSYQARNLTWNDLSFIRSHTKLPIIVKGVQCLEDVELCVKNGVQGVIISNHGGRQADYAPAAIDILYEIRTYRPDLFEKIEIMIDGGVRSGADVVKALALGAKAVGIGRPVLYANGTHGQEGVRRVIEILQEEITNTMRNIGANRIEDLKPEMVGPVGAWVGSNRPRYTPPPPELHTY